LQCRRSDERTRRFLEVMNDPPTAEAVAAERAIVQALQGDCHSPIAAWAVADQAVLTLHVAVGARGGQPPVLKASASGERQIVVQSILNSLTERNVQALLAGGR
jgi:hydroxymethylbilane synthase